ncbi:MAG: glycosyltransferase [Phycisphaerae bacterium]
MDTWPVTFSLPQGAGIGGMTSWAVRLASAIAKHRRVRLVFHQSPEGHAAPEYPSLHNQSGIDVIHAPLLRSPGNWPDCVRCYRELLPTVLFPGVLAESYALAAALASVQADRLRVVGWNHSDNPYDYAYLAYYEPLVHRYVVNSRRCRAVLRNRLPTRADDIRLIRHGVVPLPPARREPLSGRPLRLAYAGRMDHLVKRVLDLPELAALLDRRGLRFEMRLVGDGPQAGRVDEAVAKTVAAFRHRENRLYRESPRPCDRIHEVWQWADVSMLASTHEGLSLGMLEAMSAGCVPVVSRVASGADDVIEDGRNGITFPVGDVEAMANRILMLAGDPDAMPGMSEAARTTIADDFGFKSYLEHVIRLLDELPSCPPRPWSPALTLLMNPEDIGRAQGGATIPSDAADRLRALLERLAADDLGPVAVYGAGNHTRALASVWADSPVAIRAVIDDDPARQDTRLWGWPIIPPENIASCGVKSVVLSSWMHEDAMWQRRDLLTAGGVDVFRLYETKPPDQTHTAEADAPQSVATA